MISIIKCAFLFWTWATLASCSAIFDEGSLDDLYKSIFDQSEIFFNPTTKQPVPLVEVPQDPTVPTKSDSLKNVFGSLPCDCDEVQCTCCVDIKMKVLNSDDNGCVTFSPQSDEPVENSTINTAISFNNKTLAESRLSFDDPSPLCSPFPRLPLIAGCVKFNRIRTDKGHLRGCAKLEVRVTGTDAILWDMQFSCFKIGTDGIIFSNPNKNKEKPKPVKESIKEPVKKPIKKPNEECH